MRRGRKSARGREKKSSYKKLRRRRQRTTRRGEEEVSGEEGRESGFVIATTFILYFLLLVCEKATISVTSTFLPVMARYNLKSEMFTRCPPLSLHRLKALS